MEVLQRAGCFDLLIHCNRSARFFAFAQTLAWKFHDPALKFRLGQGITDASPSGDNSELSCFEYKSEYPQAWLVIDRRLICRLDVFSLLSLKSKVKVLVAMVLRSHYSQFLLFSESPMMSPIFLCNFSGSRRACARSKTFPGILTFSRVFRGIPTSRLGFLELEVIRA